MLNANKQKPTRTRALEVASTFVLGAAVASWWTADSGRPDAPEPGAASDPVAMTADVDRPPVHSTRVPIPAAESPRLPADTSILDVDTPIRRPAPEAVPESLPVHHDARVLRLYRTCVAAVEKARDRNRLLEQRGGSRFGAAARTTHRLAAIADLIAANRFHYIGDPSARPHCGQSEHIRYVSTSVGGLSMVFEISRAEFPEVFEGLEVRVAHSERSRLPGARSSGH